MGAVPGGQRSRAAWPAALLTSLVAAAAAACHLDDPQGVGPAQVLALAADSASVAADGASRTRVVARLAGGTPDGAEVTFRATAGQFFAADGAATRSVTVKAAAREAAAVYVADSRPGPVTVSASVANVSAVIDLLLRAALPREILLVPDRVVARANGAEQVRLTATLLAVDAARVVSRGLRVDFVALDSASGAELPELRGAQTLEGQATTVAHALVVRSPQTVLVVARVTEGGTTVASNQVRLNFVP